MKKTMCIILLALLLASCAPQNLEASQAPTTEIGTATSEPTIALTPEIVPATGTQQGAIPTATQTITPIPPLPFTWQGQLTLDCIPGRSWSWDTTRCKKLSLRPVFYTGTQTEFFHAIHDPNIPSAGIYPVRDTTSIVLLCGTGWWNREVRMPCEKLRTLLEGETGYQPTQNLEECTFCGDLQGLTITVSDASATMPFTVSRIVIISGDTLDEFNTADTSVFMQEHFPGTARQLFLVFCGWGPEGTVGRYDNNHRYIMVLTPQGGEPTP